MRSTKIKAVIFDADGVVLKENPFSKRYSKEFNVPLNDILLYFQNEHKLCVVGKSDFKQSISKYLDAWKWNRPVEELIEYWLKGEEELTPETMQVIKQLKQNRIPVYLATNQVHERTNHFVNRLGFNDIFDKIYSSAQIGFKKPDVNFYSHITSDLNLNPEEILFFDNDEKNIVGAKHAGITVKLFTDPATIAFDPLVKKLLLPYTGPLG